MSLANRVVVITGAAQSIGYGCAAVALREGAQVVLADIDTKLGDAAAFELARHHGDRVLFVETDVTRDDAIENLFKRAVDAFGGVDALVCSAAIFVLKTDCGRSEWAKSLDVNVISVARCCHYFSETYKKTRGALGVRGQGGSIVLFGSISGTIAQPEFAA